MNAADFPRCGPLAHAEAGPGPHTVRPPWDIERPQPAFAALARTGASRGRILDVGRIDSIEPATVDTHVHPTGIRGWLAALTRTCQDAPC